MSVVWTVAVNTFRENRRDRVLYVLVLFAAVVILAGVVVGELSPFEQGKILLDLGQATMSLVGSLIAIFLGIGLVSKEIERRTIYVIVSKPVSRAQFLVGKTAGLTMTLTAAVALMAVMLALVCGAYGVPPTLALSESIFLIWVQLVLLVAMAVTFASFTTTTLAAMFSLSCWVIGQVLGDLKSLAARSESPLTRILVGVLYWLLPNFTVLDAKARASYGIAVPTGELVSAAAYGLLYAVALLALSSIIFSRRDFR